MDAISRLRFKNLLDRLLDFCARAESEEDRAILLRVGVVTLNKLRIHADVDIELGYDIRKFTKDVKECSTRAQLVGLWDDMEEILKSYREEFVV